MHNILKGHNFIATLMGFETCMYKTTWENKKIKNTILITHCGDCPRLVKVFFFA